MRFARRFLICVALASVLAAPAAAQPAHGQAAPPDRQSRLTSAASYMPISTLSAGVLQRYTTSGTIIVDMGLDIPDAALRSRAEANAPRLRDALRTAIATYATTYYRLNAAPDPAQLARLMQSAVDRTLGAPGARVLLTNIIYQRRSG
jgi:flagellar basal body-associated protein FliL